MVTLKNGQTVEIDGSDHGDEAYKVDARQLDASYTSEAMM